MSFRRTKAMPTCVPVNDVSDINANQKPPARPPSSESSRFSKIITCLFFRKKTDVQDMTKDGAAGGGGKKQKMSVDRSERSRRVLKMESMRTAPKQREDGDSRPSSQQGPSQMFLPSENPTVRRACSEVIRTSSSSSSKPPSREAFTDGKKIVHTRNTNYRGKRPGGTLPRAKNSGNVESGSDSEDTPPKLPERRTNKVNGVRKPIVVPGIMSNSDDDIGYNSDNDEILDLHDEMRRMNLSHPDLRSAGREPTKGRRREGSISLSEDEGDSENEVPVAEQPRPQNPAPTKKTKSMEDVIDDLFVQTQSNIDTIYRNGLDNMEEIETYRSDTMTPDTCMRQLEEDLMKPNVSRADDKPSSHIAGKSKTKNEHIPGLPNPDQNPEMDNLLTEVSLWAHDRQKWLLEDSGKVKADDLERDSTMASFTTDGRVINQVGKTNGSAPKERCSNWVTDQSKPNERKTPEHQDASRTGGLLTGPKLFRSSSRNLSRRNESFGEKDREKAGTPVARREDKVAPTTTPVPSKRTYKGVQIIDFSNEPDEIEVNEKQSDPIILAEDKKQSVPEPWTSEMYTAGSKTVEHDRSTLNDNLSELDEKVEFRARSPGSWLSSNGSCSNLMLKRETNTPANDCFEVPRGVNDTPELFTKTPVTHESSVKGHGQQPQNVIKATNVGKSHQILRQTPKVHTPFMGFDRNNTPVPTAPAIPNRTMQRNTQLKPITSLKASAHPPKSNIETFPALPGMKNVSHSFKNSRNMNEFEHSPASHAMRPFSEIPLTTNDRHDKNSSLLANNVGVPQGPDSSHPFIQAMMRPVSETMQPKRSDKIGVGPIMATKDRQSYARDILNTIERQRLQPQQDAFTLAPTVSPEGNFDPVVTAAKSPRSPRDRPQPAAKKRHKVFTNSLIRGGYSYDKHSRKNNFDDRHASKSFSGQHNSTDSPLIVHSLSFQNTHQPTVASVSDLSFNFKETSSGSGQNTVITQHDPVPKSGYQNGYRNGLTISTKPVIMKTGSNDVATPTRSNSLQTHSLVSNVHQYTNDNPTGASVQSGNSQTAEKFRRLRTRRDQEMEWLMKDAAETEL